MTMLTGAPVPFSRRTRVADWLTTESVMRSAILELEAVAVTPAVIEFAEMAALIREASSEHFSLRPGC